MQAVRSAYRTSSVVFQKAHAIVDGSVGALLHSPLLNSVGSYKEVQLVDDGIALISKVIPKVTTVIVLLGLVQIYIFTSGYF